MRVKQVEQVLDLFELFAREKAPHTLTSISRRLDMPKSSTFNLIDTLVERGFLYETQQRRGYYPTRRILDVAREAMEGDSFLQRIHGELETLAAETGETVVLSVRQGGDVVYVDVVESSSLIRYFARVGQRRPVYATSSGKAILTSFPDAERAKVLAALDFVRYEASTLASPEELAADLDASAGRGWCEDRGEYTPDVMGIGVPLVYGERRFGLAVAGPMFRMLDRRLDLVGRLQEARSRIKAILAV